VLSITYCSLHGCSTSDAYAPRSWLWHQSSPPPPPLVIDYDISHPLQHSCCIEEVGTWTSALTTQWVEVPSTKQPPRGPTPNKWTGTRTPLHRSLIPKD
jgi:hypothetical protein